MRTRSGEESHTIADPDPCLTPADRAALLALARNAIQAVLADCPPPQLPDVPGARLRRGAFVTLEEQEGHARYRLLEPIRQYAHTKLLASSEASATRQRHAI